MSHPFSELAKIYIEIYREKSLTSGLHKGAVFILNHFKQKNYTQIIISAMEQKALESQITLKEINHYFNAIVGLDNIHAHSKINNARRFMNSFSSAGDHKFIYIGDTYHEYEVAKALDCKCLLVENGHQDLKRLKFDDNIDVFRDSINILDYFLNH